MIAFAPAARRVPPSPRPRWSPVMIAAACLAVLWTATAAGAAAQACTGLLAVGEPHDALTDSPAMIAALLANNLVVSLWPAALIALGWTELPCPLRRLADLIVAGELVAHGLLVGGALASQPSLWRYLPHLPLEWIGLACGAGTWAAARAGQQPRAQLALAAAAAVALAVAAVIETYAAPIR